ncbi:MAG: hypothetical protein GVY19_11790 [Bacteroidetes bacterium]|jgi:hypothetical protein|nr:hypothetical protein [Bacteroidota bacterium]
MGQVAVITEFEIFRGDSFQGLIHNPADALKTAICLRASLRRYTNNSALDDIRDARIAIGIGEGDTRMTIITESDGEVFKRSDTVLDSIKKSNERL